MSLKIYLIIINNVANINIADIPQRIGLGHAKPTKEISIQEASYAEGTSIGKFGDKIVIVSQDLVFNFYDKAPSEFEKKICNAFSNSEIAVLRTYNKALLAAG